MTKPRPSDDLPPESEDTAPLDDGTGDELDQTFADVENELDVRPAAPPHATGDAGAEGHADADEFASMDTDDIDDVFVIDEEDGAAQETPTLRRPPVQAPAAPADGRGELRHDAAVEDALFTPSTASAGSERFGADSGEFVEATGSGRAWGGHELSPEDIGINARDGDDEARDAAADADKAWSAPTEELEIVEDEAERVAGFKVGRATPAEQFGIQPIDEDEVSAPASGVWGGADSGTRGSAKAPGTRADAYAAELHAAAADQDYEPALAEGEAEAVEGDGAEAAEEEFDPIYGSEAAEGGEEAQQAEADFAPDYAEHEAAYVDDTDAHAGTVVGAPMGPRRRGPLTLVAAAALIFVGVGAGLAFMRPEWLGLHTSPVLVDRTAIARPLVSLVIAPPPVPGEAALAGDPTDPKDPGTTPTDPIAKTDPLPGDPRDPDPKADPGKPTGTDPARDPIAAQTDPTAPVRTDPGTTVKDPPVGQTDPSETPGTAVAGAREVVRVGEDLQVGPAERMPTPPRHHLAEGLVTGSQAFAQLKNMNFFLGKVKALDSSFLTLDLTPGEITLAFDDINAIVSLASEEYRMMHGTPNGYVRLRNRNKLFGKILNNSLADNVVLEVQQNQVVIPRASIEEVGQQIKESVQVLQDEDSDWIKTILQKQAAQKPSGAAGSPTPAPTGGAGAAPPSAIGR